MRKKMMLVALAVVSAASFALPAIASAQEIHLEPGEKFTITGAGLEARAEGEPTVTCEGLGGGGSFTVGSSTTGTMTRDYTGCHVTVVFTIPCHTIGSPVNNTVATSGTFHLITLQSGIPAVLMTTVPVEVECAGISRVTFTGSLIGTITSPKCGESSKTVGLSFSSTGTSQNDMTYTGVKYDLQSRTGEEAEKTAGLVGNATAMTANAQKLNCT